MRFYSLDRKVVRISPKAAGFLNGLTSNTLDKPQNAFLDIHGKIIAVFDQLEIDEDTIVILLAAFAVPAVQSHLDRYLKLNRSTFEILDLKVYFDIDGKYIPAAGDFVFKQKAGQIVATGQQLAGQVSEEEFKNFRLANNIPLHGIDYTDDFLLNVSTREQVSFTKGCYLGQEPVSKVYNRSKPTWRLVVKDADKCSSEESAKMTSRARDPQSGKERGFVFEHND